jgi:hypothetical protein
VKTTAHPSRRDGGCAIGNFHTCLNRVARGLRIGTVPRNNQFSRSQVLSNRRRKNHSGPRRSEPQSPEGI